MKATHFQHWRYKNDINGNPRRLWVFFNAEGNVRTVIDENYGGRPAACKGLVDLGSVEIAPGVYRAMKKEWKL